MKYLLSSILCLLVSTGFSQTNLIKSAHDATYHIGQETVVEAAECSATAIGPHALLTASHCELATDELQTEELDDPLTITSRIRDGSDHTIYIVNADFDTYVKVNQKDELVQGEDVFFFGNPGHLHDMYRKGYITGSHQDSGFFSEGPKEILFDMNGWHGDSGAAIFNNKGEIISVVSGRESQGEEKSDDTFKLVASFVLNFKQEDLDKVYDGVSNIKVVKHKEIKDSKTATAVSGKQ